MDKKIYRLAKEFKNRYPFTVAWRLKSHSKVIGRHLNPDEEVMYVFAAQKGESNWDIISTNVAVLTNKRLILGRKRLLFGYFFCSITPDLFNDFKINMGIFWGDIHIDTMSELVTLSNIQKGALPEIEIKITELMMRQKNKQKEMAEAQKK